MNNDFQVFKFQPFSAKIALTFASPSRDGQSSRPLEDWYVECAQTVEEVLYLMPVLLIGHRIGQKKASTLCGESDAPRNPRYPDEERARKRTFEHERRVIALRFYPFPVMIISCKPAALRTGTVPVDRF
jgi:hypothetical protein